VVTQFTANQFGSTASSVSSAAAGWHRLASSALSSMHEPPPQPSGQSCLGVPMSPLSVMQFTAGGGAFQPVIDLNRTPVADETLSGHIKTPRARAAEDLPGMTNPAKCQCSPWARRYCSGLVLRSNRAV
jgi:hypothetical protein